MKLKMGSSLHLKRDYINRSTKRKGKGMRKIKVIIKRPDEEYGHVSWISDTLSNLQKTVEGYIETFTVSEDVVIICNEEGLIKQLPFNCRLCEQDFFGTIIVAGVNGDEFDSIPENLTMPVFKQLYLGSID